MIRFVLLTTIALLTGCASTTHYESPADRPASLGTVMFLVEKAKQEAVQEGAQAAVDYIGKALSQQQRRPGVAPVTSE